MTSPSASVLVSFIVRIVGVARFKTNLPVVNTLSRLLSADGTAVV
jgi:hypothetical protein